jgi:hypothetical protein
MPAYLNLIKRPQLVEEYCSALVVAAHSEGPSPLLPRQLIALAPLHLDSGPLREERRCQRTFPISTIDLLDFRRCAKCRRRHIDPSRHSSPADVGMMRRRRFLQTSQFAPCISLQASQIRCGFLCRRRNDALRTSLQTLE